MKNDQEKIEELIKNSEKKTIWKIEEHETMLSKRVT